MFDIPGETAAYGLMSIPEEYLEASRALLVAAEAEDVPWFRVDREVVFPFWEPLDLGALSVAMNHWADTPLTGCPGRLAEA